jgi:hypothetical protein
MEEVEECQMIGQPYNIRTDWYMKRREDSNCYSGDHATVRKLTFELTMRRENGLILVENLYTNLSALQQDELYFIP